MSRPPRRAAGLLLLLLLTLAARRELAAKVAPGGAAGAVSPADWVWWEAEAPKASNFPGANPFAPAPRSAAAAALSGGAWIGASEPGKLLFLEYEIAVPRSGAYHFYARKFWSHGPFRWRFDDRPWQPCDRSAALLDEVALAPFVVANWVHVGNVELAPGKHVVRIELTSTTGSAAFDCFLLTPRLFRARGKLKPGERHPAPEASDVGWFAFDPELDRGTDARGGPALLDLRSLNEASAGDSGFIQTRGASFIHQKSGEVIRFWGVNAGHGVLGHDREELDHFARHLAKLGVNLVRLHGPLWKEDDPTQVDEDKLRKIHTLTAALRRQGIYLELSSYFPLWLRPKGVAGLAGYDGDKPTFGLPFWSAHFRDLQRGWWRRALSAKSPETGLSLLEDPTLALIEIQNEDSLFFWTFAPYDNVPAAQMEILEKRFGRWLAGQYGGVTQALASWKARGSGGGVRGDDVGKGRVGFMPLPEVLARRDARAQDTVRFLTELQKDYYDDMRDELKIRLGFRGSVTGSNWVTADDRVLGPLDKWSNTGLDFMDRHGYYGGPHVGERASYAVSAGDRFRDASALGFESAESGERGGPAAGGQPILLPIMDLAYNGKPSIVSEINWPMPNRFRSELPALCATYGSLQGSDGFVFFATEDLEWTGALAKFSIGDPAILGQFPAAALIYRNGLVRTGEPVVHLEEKLQDLYSLAGLGDIASELGRPGTSAPAGGSDHTARWYLPWRQEPVRASGPAIDPLAFLIGRVEIDITADGGSSRVAGVGPSLVDRQRRIVRSSTAELSWDWGRGLAIVDAPGAQGATGFLGKAGAIELADVSIASPMEYGSVLVVSMDGLPLRASARILVQVMSEDRNSGWSAPELGAAQAAGGTRASKAPPGASGRAGGAWRTIANVGGAPLLVKNIEGRLSFKRRDAASLRVRPLDPGGYGADIARPIIGSGGELTLLPGTLHYVLEKAGAP